MFKEGQLADLWEEFSGDSEELQKQAFLVPAIVGGAGAAALTGLGAKGWRKLVGTAAKPAEKATEGLLGKWSRKLYQRFGKGKQLTNKALEQAKQQSKQLADELAYQKRLGLGLGGAGLGAGYLASGGMGGSGGDGGIEVTKL